MTLVNILVFSLFGLLVAWLAPVKWRGWIALSSSLLAIFWMQPSVPIRNLDFWLPYASIALTLFTWIVTRSSGEDFLRQHWISVGFVLGMIISIGLTRYMGIFCCLTRTEPPQLTILLVGIALTAGFGALIFILSKKTNLDMLLIVLIIGLFILTKSNELGRFTSAGLRAASGQDPHLASAQDLQWLGFSYLALRLIHTLRDHQAGRLPAYSLSEFITYALFFPAFTAGPIDRSQHFSQELRLQQRTGFGQILDGGQRIFLGIFKKFVLADSLALISLSSQNAPQLTSTPWTWVILYAFAFRIYFDFSGYTDIALGIGTLFGIRLPENFTAPYLKTNLTSFWNSWHITLAQWFRAYFFYPVTRVLRSNPQKIPAWTVVLIGQVGTMLLIGLWHGFSWNFIVWGGWHALGLFIHNRWSEWIRRRTASLETRKNTRRALAFGGWLLTFNYVSLGWVWFALPTLGDSIKVFHKLFGL